MFKSKKDKAQAPADDQIAERLLGEKATVTKPVRRQRKLTTIEALLRTSNILIAILIITFSVFSYFSSDLLTPDSKDLSLTILPFYIGFSGLLILGVEFGIGFLRRSFKFLTTMFGRGVFSIFVGLMCLCMVRANSKDYQKVFVYIIVSLLCLVGIMSILASLLCCKTHKSVTLKESTLTS